MLDNKYGPQHEKNCIWNTKGLRQWTIHQTNGNNQDENWIKQNVLKIYEFETNFGDFDESYEFLFIC